MTRSRLLVSLLSSCMAVCAVVSVASAQTEGGLPPPASSPPPAPAPSHGRGRGFGLGAVGYLAPNMGGLSIAFDPGIWHMDAFVGLGSSGGDDNYVALGARFWYHLKTVGAADFSIGGGASYARIDPGPGDAASALYIEGGGLIRVFIVDNVALGASTGLVIGTADADGYQLGATNLVGTASLHYFF
jgi:hypothetical protein